jgi:transcriptional regulator with XRE-family HTH domain
MRFPAALREWRSRRRYSQLDLALEAGVSARHLSFLETGRARPSREMIERLGEALELPLHARNELLVTAGFAARYGERGLDSDEMSPVRAAIAHTLERHQPYPGFAIDRMWTVRRMNAAAKRLFGALGLVEGGSLLELLLSGTLPAFIDNWVEVAHHSALRLRAESLQLGGVPEMETAARLLETAGRHHALPAGPVVPVVIRQGETRLSLFATVAQFGTPQDVTLADLKIELFFPADQASALILEAMTGQGIPTPPISPAHGTDQS